VNGERTDSRLATRESGKIALQPERTLARHRTIAIIGASSDRAKFGNKAVRAYAAEGWTVWPVNPKGGVIEGLTVFTSILELPELPERASLYLHEVAALETLDSLAEAQTRCNGTITEVFLNPGVGRASVRERADELGLHHISECSIRAIGRVPVEFLAD